MENRIPKSIRISKIQIYPDGITRKLISVRDITVKNPTNQYIQVSEVYSQGEYNLETDFYLSRQI